MSKLSTKIGVSNKTQRPRVVWVEPWAEDFTLLKGEELEIVFQCNEEQAWLHIDEWDDSTQIYVMGEGINGYDVIQEGRRLKCGHNRQAGSDTPQSSARPGISG